MWYVAARYYKDAAPAETKTPADIIEAATAAIENKPARSAWAHGVKACALSQAARLVCEAVGEVIA